jgi:hypothetical protein
MNKQQFKNLIKECVKEVLEEDSLSKYRTPAVKKARRALEKNLKKHHDDLLKDREYWERDKVLNKNLKDAEKIVEKMTKDFPREDLVTALDGLFWDHDFPKYEDSQLPEFYETLAARADSKK